jgi:broad specificity phosphatase PhoE
MSGQHRAKRPRSDQSKAAGAQAQLPGRGFDDYEDEDCGLSERGTQQILFNMTRKLEHFEPVARVVCSPLRRCLLSAAAAYPHHQIFVDARLREVNHGHKSKQDVRALIDEILPDRTFDLAGVPETATDANHEEENNSLGRLRAALLDVQQQRKDSKPKLPTAIVFHADCIRAITGRHPDANCVDSKCKKHALEGSHKAADCKGKTIPFPKPWGGPRAWPLNFKPYRANLSSAFGKDAGPDNVPWVAPPGDDDETPSMILVRHADSLNNEKRRNKRSKKKK